MDIRGMLGLTESQLSKDLKDVMKTPEGNRVLNNLWKRYVEGIVTTDKVEITYYELGKRDLVLELFTEMKFKPQPMENDNE